MENEIELKSKKSSFLRELMKKPKFLKENKNLEEKLSKFGKHHNVLLPKNFNCDIPKDNKVEGRYCDLSLHISREEAEKLRKEGKWFDSYNGLFENVEVESLEDDGYIVSLKQSFGHLPILGASSTTLAGVIVSAGYLFNLGFDKINEVVPQTLSKCVEIPGFSETLYYGPAWIPIAAASTLAVGFGISSKVMSKELEKEIEYIQDFEYFLNGALGDDLNLEEIAKGRTFYNTPDGETVELASHQEYDALFKKNGEIVSEWGGMHNKIVEKNGEIFHKIDEDDFILAKDNGKYAYWTRNDGTLNDYDGAHDWIKGIVDKYIHCQDGDAYKLVDKEGNTFYESKKDLGEFKGKKVIAGKENLIFEYTHVPLQD